MKNIFTICLLIVFNLIGSVHAKEESVYPKYIDGVLYQRDLHGATQAYLWGQSLATSCAFMDGNLRVADYMDDVTYTTPFEKRFTHRDEVVPNEDGSVTITFTNSCDSMDNCIETVKGEDFFVYFRAYAPKKAFFAKSWQLSEIRKLD